MKDTNQRTNRLTIAVLFFVALIVIGFISLTRPKFEYGSTPAETLEQILTGNDEMTPGEAQEIAQNETTGYKFVDIRNPYEFVKGNITGSVNIPFQNFLSDENVEFFDKMKMNKIKLVIYGWNQTEANGPWMILKQLGYDNVKILLGGYGFYSGKISDKESQYVVEEPKYNFLEVMESLTDGAQIDNTQNTTEVIVPVRKKKKTKVEGGC